MTQIREDYEAGMSLAQLAAEYQMGTIKIRRLLIEDGATIRPAHAPKDWNKGKTAWFTIDSEVEAKLDAWCDAHGTSKTLVINAALDLFFTIREMLKF